MIHDVVSVSVSDIATLDTGTQTRTITIIDQHGNDYAITIFSSQDETDLIFKLGRTGVTA